VVVQELLELVRVEELSQIAAVEADRERAAAALEAELATKKRYAERYQSSTALASLAAREASLRAKHDNAVAEAQKRGADTESAAASSGGVGIDLRRVFIETQADIRRLRAAKLAALRLKTSAHVLSEQGEDSGSLLSLDSDDPAQLQRRCQRLIARVSEVRIRRSAAHRSWRRAYQRVRMTEAGLLGDKGRLTVLRRSLEMVRSEKSRVEKKLRSAGVSEPAILASDAITTALHEAGEIEVFIEQQQGTIDVQTEQLESQLIDLAAQSAILQAATRRALLLESRLRDARLHLSKLISDAKRGRREAKATQERATAEAATAVAVIAQQQVRVAELRLEWVRISHVSSRWFDTSVWNSAGPVRVRTEELRAWLQDELLKQKIVLAEGIASVESLHVESDSAEADYGRLHDDLLALVKVLAAVVGCMRLAPRLGPSSGEGPIKDAEAEVDAGLKRAIAAKRAGIQADEHELDEDDNGVDEDNVGEHDKLDGAGNSSAKLASSNTPRRKANVAWRNAVLARAADASAMLAEVCTFSLCSFIASQLTVPSRPLSHSQVLSSREPNALAELGALTESVPTLSAQLGWVTSSWLAGGRDQRGDYGPQDLSALSLGYASQIAIADGLSAVIGTPCHYALSALPFPSAEPRDKTMHDDESAGLAAAMAQAEAEARAKSKFSSGAAVKRTGPLHDHNSSDDRVRAESLVMALRQPGTNRPSAAIFRFVAPTVGEQLARAGLRLVPECIRGVLVRWKPAQDRSRSEKQWCVSYRIQS
jgi:hypothetical protein